VWVCSILKEPGPIEIRPPSSRHNAGAYAPHRLNKSLNPNQLSPTPLHSARHLFRFPGFFYPQSTPASFNFPVTQNPLRPVAWGGLALSNLPLKPSVFNYGLERNVCRLVKWFALVIVIVRFIPLVPRGGSWSRSRLRRRRR